MAGKLVTRFVVLLVIILATGCGNKGDLFLPEREASPPQSDTRY